MRYPNNPKLYEVKRHLIFGTAEAGGAHLQKVRKGKTPTTTPPPQRNWPTPRLTPKKTRNATQIHPLWGAAKEGWPRNPPLPRFFLLLHVTTAPEHFEHKHHTFNAPTLGDIGSRVGAAQFWGVFGNPVLGKNPPRNPPSWPGRGVPRGVPGQEPPPS